MDWREFGVTINHVFRYGYGGLLCFLVGALVEPDVTKETVAALGNILSPLIAFAVGGALYAFYRPVIGDVLIFSLFNWMHRKMEPRWGYRKDKEGGRGYNCKCHYLEEQFGVAHANRLNAFRIVRNKLFEKEMGKRFEVQHSEIFLLYLSTLVLFLGSLYLVGKQMFTGWNQVGLTVVFGLTSLACLGFGMWADISLCRTECAELMTVNREDIEKLLQWVEYAEKKGTDGRAGNRGGAAMAC